MAQTKLHDSPAKRQAAYHARKTAAAQSQLAAQGLPPLPAITSMPSEARWKALIQNAHWALHTVTGEMQTYFDDRSEKWQQNEKGEDFQTRLEELVDITDSLSQFHEDQSRTPATD